MGLFDGLLQYFSLKNIIVTRNEANKKTGHVGIDENGTVNLLNALKQKITEVDITLRDDGFGFLTQAYTIDGYNGNKYDFIIYAGISYIDIINIAKGQEIVCICNNADPTPALLVVSSTKVIKWLNNAVPQIETNAKIIFYRSKNIIYAEILKPYIGGGGSDSDGS
jgi:hypothetical protein